MQLVWVPPSSWQLNVAGVLLAWKLNVAVPLVEPTGGELSMNVSGFGLKV